MKLLNRKEPLILVIGDLFFFLLSLWLSLTIRNLEAPTREAFFLHVVPFSVLFVVWIIVFYIAGLYEKHTVVLKTKLPTILFNTLLANSGLAIVFFYLLPLFGITPKTILFIYLIISFFAVLFWRMYGYFFIARGPQLNAVLIGSGDEMR